MLGLELGPCRTMRHGPIRSILLCPKKAPGILRSAAEFTTQKTVQLEPSEKTICVALAHSCQGFDCATSCGEALVRQQPNGEQHADFWAQLAQAPDLVLVHLHEHEAPRARPNNADSVQNEA